MRAHFAGLVLLVCGANASSPPSYPPANLQDPWIELGSGSGSGIKEPPPSTLRPPSQPPPPLASSPPSYPPANLQDPWIELGSGSGSGIEEPPPSPLRPPSPPAPPQMPVIVTFKASGTKHEFRNAAVVEGIKATMANVVGVVSGYTSNLHPPCEPVLAVN